jgi:oligosaccharyltransferase complex subunit gamma
MLHPTAPHFAMISQTGIFPDYLHMRDSILTITSPQTAEQVRSWIARTLPDRPHPAIKRPINWVRVIAVTTTILGTVTFLFVAWPYLLPILQSRNVWAAVSLIAILLFTSGHMFNHIRKVPYVSGDGRGGVSYFAGGFSNQYGLETQIVAAMCKSTQRCRLL